MPQHIIQITVDTEEQYTRYYLPSRKPGRLLMVTDHKDLLDALTVEEVSTAKIKPPQATFMQPNISQTLEKLIAGK